MTSGAGVGKKDTGATVAGNTASGADSSAYWLTRGLQKWCLSRVAGGVQCCNCDANAVFLYN